MAGQSFKRSIDSVAGIYRFSEDMMAAKIPDKVRISPAQTVAKTGGR